MIVKVLVQRFLPDPRLKAAAELFFAVEAEIFDYAAEHAHYTGGYFCQMSEVYYLDVVVAHFKD